MDNEDVKNLPEPIACQNSRIDSQSNVLDELSEEQWSILDQKVEMRIQNQQVNQNTVSTVQSEQTAVITATVDEDDATEPSLEHLNCLRSKFGFCQFRDKQWDIINAVMNQKRDVCAVMATGYGKSLCFQFPAVYKQKMVLVVCPLISLMRAQVIALEQLNIKACLVGTAQNDPNILSRIQNGEFCIIYSSPEFLQGNNGSTMLHLLKDRLTLIAIDESHCVSNWGFDFRPDYRRLNIVRGIIPDVPILALTATATDKVRHDIHSMLGLRNVLSVGTSFDRPNLEFIVHEKSASVWTDLEPWVTNISGSVIVYVLKRVETEGVVQTLEDHGVIAAAYHAGIPIIDRDKVLVDFLTGDLKIIVATSAFGMGIDKKDIRTVVHYGAAKNLEHYYQEVGRAGRDGQPSKAVTYFDLDDFNSHDWFLEKENEQKKLANYVKMFLRDLGLSLREYLHSTKCRRKMILNYFNEDTSSLVVRSDCCDNCANGVSTWRLYTGFMENGTYDFTSDGRLLLNAIQEMETKQINAERHTIVGVLRGYITGYRHLLHSCFGKGEMRRSYYWNALIDLLTSKEYLDFVAGHTHLALSGKAHWYLSQPSEPLHLNPAGAVYRFFQPKMNTPIANHVWSRRYLDHGSMSN